MEHIKFNTTIAAVDLIALAKGLLGTQSTFEAMNIDQLDDVIGVSDGRYAAPNTLCFVDKEPKQEAIKQLDKAFVISGKKFSQVLNGCCGVLVEDPRALFIDMLNSIMDMQGFCYFSSAIQVAPAVDSSAEIHSTAVLEDGVSIGPGSYIAAGCVIKRGTFIGRNAIIRENTVIGCDGISLHKAKDGRVMRFPHLAGVIIEDDVEIGASCVLPRGILGSTRIGRGCVIGNLCNVGHAVQIGAKVWMSVGCLIGGNSTIGAGSTLGLGVSMRDNLCIGENCSIGMGSVVTKDVPNNSSLFGNPARRLPDINAGPDR